MATFRCFKDVLVWVED